MEEKKKKGVVGLAEKLGFMGFSVVAWLSAVGALEVGTWLLTRFAVKSCLMWRVVSACWMLLGNPNLSLTHR